MTETNPISEVLAAPLGPDWTIEGMAEKLLSAVAAQPGKEPKEFIFDSTAVTDQQSRRLARPLLACLANMSAAESGTSGDIFGGQLSFKRSGPEGPVEIVGQFENKQGQVRIALKKHELYGLMENFFRSEASKVPQVEASGILEITIPSSFNLWTDDQQKRLFKAVESLLGIPGIKIIERRRG